MNVTNIGIGMLFSSLAFHVAIIISVAVWYSNFDTTYVPGDPECANATYAAINAQVCDSPGWLHSTPLEPILTALPKEGSFTFAQMITMTPAIIIALIHLLYPNYEILYDVDQFIEIIIVLIRIASIISILMLLLTAGRTLAGGVAGTLGRRF